MKYFKLTILVIISLLITTSCLDDMVDSDPKHQLPEETLITDETSAMNALYGVYDGLQDEYATNAYYICFVEVYADAVAHTGTYQISEGAVNSIYSNNTILGTTWRRIYQIIIRANKVIKSVTDLPSDKISNDARKQILGESHFIRAYAYFKLVNLFGAVPLQLEPLAEGLTNIHLEKSSEADVYAQIKMDLQVAITNLDHMQSAGEQFFANKDVAIGLLGKVQLYTNENPTTIVSTLSPVINNTNLGLVSYSDLWTQSANTEGLLRVDATAADGNSLAFFFDKGKGGRHEVGASEFLRNSFEPNDKRADFIVNKVISGANYWVITKYNDVSSGSGQDKPYILRLADVYLIYAEANMKVGTATAIAEANTYYNLVRTRAGLGTKTLTSSNWKDLILAERNVELFAEGDRWFDLKRQGVAEQYIKAKLGTDAFTKVKDKYLLWPIPQAEINGNNKLNESDQNPGY